MERLTYKAQSNCGYIWALHSPGCSIQAAIDRLAAYEDTGLEPEEVAELVSPETVEIARLLEKMCTEGSAQHILELFQAEKDGRLVVLPCKVRDTVWVVFDDSTRKAVYETRVQGISITTRSTAILNFVGYPVQYAWGSEVGKTVFLTREEAEAALAGGDNNA